MPLLHIPPLEKQLYTLVKNIEEFIYGLKTKRKWDLARWKNILMYTDKKYGTVKKFIMFNFKCCI